MSNDFKGLQALCPALSWIANKNSGLREQVDRAPENTHIYLYNIYLYFPPPPDPSILYIYFFYCPDKRKYIYIKRKKYRNFNHLGKCLNFPYWTKWTELKRVSDNPLKSLNFFRQRWTDFCPLCPPALSTRCPPAVQPENKYSIYFSGRKNTVFIFGLEKYAN